MSEGDLYMRNTTASYLFSLLVGSLIPIVFLCACSTSEKNLNRKYSTRYFSLSLPQNYVLDTGSEKDDDTECEMYFYDRETYKAQGQSFYVGITAKKQSAAEYRRYMLQSIDLKSFAEGTLPTTQVGGKDFVTYKAMASQGESLFCRDESSGISIWIHSSPNALFLPEILDSIRFTLPELGLTDPVFLWNRKPLPVETSCLYLGNFEFEVKQFFFSTRVMDSGGKNAGATNAAYHVAASENYLYTFNPHNDVLTAYRIHDDQLILDTSTTVTYEYSQRVPLSNKGTYFDIFSPCGDGFFLAEHINREKEATLLPLFGCVGVVPYQNTVLFFDRNDGQVYKQELIPGLDCLDYSDWSFRMHLPGQIPEMSELVYATEHYIIMQTPASLGDTMHYDAHVFDLDGKYLMTLQGKNNYGYDFCEVNGCILGLYNYPARLVMWDQKGNLIGQLEQENLFGFSCPENDEQPVSMACVPTIPIEAGQQQLMMLISYYVDGIPEVYAFRIKVTAFK